MCVCAYKSICLTEKSSQNLQKEENPKILGLSYMIHDDRHRANISLSLIFT